LLMSAYFCASSLDLVKNNASLDAGVPVFCPNFL
jgi:hypothetical protein